ncbi:hypothetical protein niasHT_033638 [Heterodera trifolii]|uniref:Uncharacterized protein n=1 Tax=Heterodera trifolii TaxID=157864 RepID=A0ABD2IQ58_9BILA
MPPYHRLAKSLSPSFKSVPFLRQRCSSFDRIGAVLPIGALWKQYRSERARVVEEYTAAIAILAPQENVWPSPPDPKVPSTSAAWEHNYVPISPDYAATLM